MLAIERVGFSGALSYATCVQGTAYGKKVELHKLAEANRAYANLRN